MNLWLWTKKRKKKPTKSVCIPSLKKKKQQIIPKVNAFIHICTRRQLCTYMTVLYAISLTFSISLFSLARQRVRKGEKVDKRKTWLARKYNHQQKKNCVLLLCHQMQMVRIWWNLCVSRYSTVQCSLLFHNRSILFRIVEAVYTTTLLPYLFSLLRIFCCFTCLGDQQNSERMFPISRVSVIVCCFSADHFANDRQKDWKRSI